MGYYCRGLEYIYFDKTDLAIADFKKATEINKDFVHAYGKLGMLYSQKENFNDAITAYSTAFQLNPNCGLEPSLANAHYCRGSIFLQKEDYNKAIADLDQAIRLNGKYAFSYFNRGMAYFEKGDLDQSIKDFSQAILCGINMAIVYGNRGEAYRRKGQLAAAIQDLEKAISLEPNDEDWKKNLRAIREQFDKESLSPSRSSTGHERNRRGLISIIVIIVGIISAVAIIFNGTNNSRPVSKDVASSQSSSVVDTNKSMRDSEVVAQHNSTTNVATHKITTNDGSNLRLRDEPSIKGKQIASLDNGSYVQVLEIGVEFVDSDGYAGNWMRIRTQNDQTGWCFGAYLTKL
jgi:tetratricopeptide (TPR) repeat protein